MRLVQRTLDGSFHLTTFTSGAVPPYAILSHTWGRGEHDEVTYQDLVNGTGRSKEGFEKLQFCSRQAQEHGLDYFWIDTCCIDKSSSSELNEAINSMFRWYQRAERCYVYLTDILVRTQDGQVAHPDQMLLFQNSRWFTRGWTLQELLAPQQVEFYSRDKVRLGDKASLIKWIYEATGINPEALRGADLSKFSIEERLGWAVGRQTTKEEDMVYALFGICNVFIPLIYGEGHSNALRRLRKEIADLRNPHDQQFGEGVEAALSRSLKASSKTTTHADSVAISMRSPQRFHCTRRCLCGCHLRNYYASSRWLSRLLGAISFKGNCRSHPTRKLEWRVWLPPWLKPLNIYVLIQTIVGGYPSFGISFQRRVAWGEDSIIRFAYIGYEDGVKELLSRRKAFLDDTDPIHGLTALHYAAQGFQLGLCKLLLDQGADPHLEDLDGVSAHTKAWERIFAGTGTDDERCYLKCLFKETDIESWNFGPYHESILLTNKPSLAELIRDKSTNANIDDLDALNRTSLHWAALRGDLEAVKLLLEAGANPNLTDHYGSTPFLYAASSGQCAMIALFLSNGANTSQKNGKGNAALFCAARYGNDLPSVKMLVESGAKIETKNNVGLTPFAGAGIVNNCAIGEYLQAQGADIDSPSYYGDTPLFTAIYDNKSEFLEFLLANGARRNVLNQSGNSILHTAALEADTKTICILSNANLEQMFPLAKNHRSETALGIAQARTAPPPGFLSAFKHLMQSLGFGDCVI